MTESRIRRNEEIGSSHEYVVAWTGTPATYNIASNDPGKGTAAQGRPCRAIVTGTAGTLVATRPDGTSVTLPSVSNGHRWDLQAISLANTSTAQNVVVIW